MNFAPLLNKVTDVPVNQPVPRTESHDDERCASLPHIEKLEDHTDAIVPRSAQLSTALGLMTPLGEEPSACGSAADLTPSERVLVAELVADGLSIQSKFRPEPLYRKSGKGDCEGDPVEEIRRAQTTKPSA